MVGTLEQALAKRDESKYEIGELDSKIIGKPVRVDFPLELDQHQMRRVAEKIHAIAAEYEKASLRTDLRPREAICLLRHGIEQKRWDIKEITSSVKSRDRKDS